MTFPRTLPRTQRRQPSYLLTSPLGGPPPRRAATNKLAGVVVVALAAACSGGNAAGVALPSKVPTSPTSPTSLAPSAEAPNEKTEVLRQYRAFWTHLAAVSRLRAPDRRVALSRFAADPELKSMLAGMARLDGQQRVLYGLNVPRATAEVASNGVTAVVDDCQDSTRAGVANRKTLVPLTVGVKRNHVVATMRRSADQPWRVTFVSYTKTPC